MNRFLADRQWRDSFDQVRVTMREATEMEARLLDASLDEAEWTKVWAEYAGLLGRMGFLQGRVLARRIELLGE